MKRDFIWLAAVLLALFFSPITRDRYQATSVGDRALVLDKTTGEGWISIECSPEIGLAEVCLVPLVYGFDQFEGQTVLPEETRTDKNTSWSTWAKGLK